MKTKGLVQAFFYNNPDNYPPIINGTRLLAESGWDVELYCRDDGKDWNVVYPKNVIVERILLNARTSRRKYLSFCKQALRQGKKSASVFIAHETHGLLPAWLLATLYRRPLVYHCYDYAGNGYSAGLSTRLLKGIEVVFARTADMVTVPDEGLAKLVIDDLRLKCDPIVMVNSPISRPNGGGALQKALKDRGYTFKRVILRQGRIGPGHAIEATVRSIPHWVDRDWGFVVMGLGDPSYLDSLIQLAASLGVGNQFVVLPPVGYDQLADFTCDADVGHALYEPIHINNINISGACKIQEYMAAGLPLLVSDRPSLRRLTEQYHCGITVDESSPTCIAKAVNALLSDAARIDQFGRAGRDAFDTTFRFGFQFDPVIQSIENLACRNHF